MIKRDKVVGETKIYTVNDLAPGTNRIVQVTDVNGKVERALSYRDGGDLVSDQATGGDGLTYAYNALKRPVLIQRNGWIQSEYAYNAFGQRVWREIFTIFSIPTAQIVYTYDQTGHVLAEHNAATGVVMKEYVWLNDQLLSEIDSSTAPASVYYVHGGQIGEPLVMTDATKAKVWDGFVDPYGIAQTFSSTSATIDLRLPGQWQQTEAGPLYQNGMRDYDPSLGRYIQPDPLGIDAGQNVYAYVDGDPLNNEDPDGLSSIVFDRGSGTLTVYNGNGQPVGTFPASNNPVDPSRNPDSRPPYSPGTYPYTGWSPKPVDPNGPYGSNGVFHFPHSGCPGCEVHSGRANRGGPKTKTLGCIRTVDPATELLHTLIQNGDPLTTLTVK